MQTNLLPDSSPAPKSESSGYLLTNLLQFGRLLRNLGMHISTRQIYELAEGLTYINISRREDFYHAACGFLVHSPDELDIFQRAFDLFWSGKFEVLMELGLAYQQRVKEQPELPDSEHPAIEKEILQHAALPESEGDHNLSQETHLAPTYSPIE